MDTHQPQPMEKRRSIPRVATRGERFSAGLLAIGCFTVLVIAAWLQADHDGHGTHTQLGMSECTWASHFDAPCATCGMTTSFAYAADSRWVASFATQPFGAALAILTSIVFWGGLHVSATGSRLGTCIAPLLSSRSLIIGAVLFLLAWAYKWMIW